MKKIVWQKYESGITKFLKKNKRLNKVLFQNNGTIFLPEDAPDVKFNLWEGQCDFILNQIEYLKICRIYGIEAVAMITPYKIRIGIAKLFNVDAVLAEIDKILNPFKGVHEEIIKEYKKIAQNRYPDFILYEDIHKMIHITDEAGKESMVDGFLILDHKTTISGV